MEKEEPPRYSLVKIKGRENEGTLFVIDYVDGLRGKKAELKSISLDSQIIKGVPIEQLEYVSPITRNPIDYFTKVVVQGLESRVGEIAHPVFHCNTIFKAYQFRPLLKYIKNPDRRLLIADETGLGKTIEAGYIIINEMSESAIKRIVIICPSNIERKWKGELWYRFGLRFDIVSGKELLNLISNHGEFYCIASMDSIRSFGEDELFGLPLKSEIDLLIIDEIHHLIGREGETLRRKLGLALSSISKRVIGLTATPIHLDFLDLKRIFDVIYPGFITEDRFEREMRTNSHLNRLYRILSKNDWNGDELKHFLDEVRDFQQELSSQDDLNQFIGTMKDRILAVNGDKKIRYGIRKEIRDRNTFSKIFTRTTKVEVGEKRTRVIRNEKISLSSNFYEAYQEGRLVKVSEKTLFKEIDDFVQKSFYPVHRRQLSSCLPAMINLLRNGMRGFNIWINDALNELDVSLNESERNYCMELVNKSGLLREDSKWNRLVETINDLRIHKSARKVIVFTEWIPTINYLTRRKNDLDCTCYVISGLDNEESRFLSVQSFQRHEGFAVLFTTDVMSEGIDLQSADCIINYDLPYNPQKIEQRIGRIDRVGQKSETLLVINMILEESTDEAVYNILLERLGVFEEAIGDLPDILLEKVERNSVIDEDSVFQALREYEVKHELMQSDLLVGIDDVLDDEIRITYLQDQRDEYKLRWMVFERFMYILLGKEKLDKAIPDGCSLIFRELDSSDIDVLSNLVQINEKALVLAELQSAVSKDRTLSIAFRKGADGLYLTPFHPLMRKATEICYQSFYQDMNLDSVETENLVLRGDLERGKDKTRFLFLVEFKFEGEVSKSREWFWWSFDKNEETKILDTSPLEDLWKGYKEKKLLIELSTMGYEKPSLLQSEILRRLETWKNEMGKKDFENHLATCKAETQRFNEQLLEIQKMLNRETDSTKVNRLQSVKKELERKLEDSKSVYKELQSGHHSYKDGRSSYRIVMVLSFGT
ncbi:MAG: helicase-related protein [Nitrososphaeria archaeon]